MFGLSLASRGLVVDVYPIDFKNYHSTFTNAVPSLVKLMGWRFIDVIDSAAREYIASVYAPQWPESTSEGLSNAVESISILVSSVCDACISDGKFDMDDVDRLTPVFEREIRYVASEMFQILSEQLPDREFCAVYDPRWVHGELILSVEFLE